MSFKNLKNKTPVAQPADTPPIVNTKAVDDLKAQLAAAQVNANAAITKTEVEPNPDTNQGFLSLFQGQGDSINALIDTVETDGNAGGQAPFAVLTQVNGTSGGAFQRVELKNHSDADLPEGKKDFLAVFLGYRFMATAWPTDEYTKGSKSKPVFSCAVPASRSDVASSLMMSGRNYQFSKTRHDWAVSEGGPGIIKPIIEMLLLDPTDNSLFVYRCCGHYNSAKDTRDQLLAQAAENNGKKSMMPFVGMFKPQTVSKPLANGNSVVHHYAEISKLDITDDRARKAWKAYQTMATTASQDIQDKVRNWLNGADAPLTDACIEALKAGAEQ